MNGSASRHTGAPHPVAAQAGLPAPDEPAATHSARLAALLRREMDSNGGAISFARFMELALYAPGLGYYSSGSRKFGAEGDFVTAPEISPLFSRCVARQAQQVLARDITVFDMRNPARPTLRLSPPAAEALRRARLTGMGG